ncbi:oxygenase MpaB family protein [Actinoplanes sp. L3-i22]|uniref:oxygenase MpaB family protein n=1 Tax=Actinoplanes sp. L3-i22 TaxID=2836373 RepID=UPI001C74DB89|nr:oxygenase MpaB family protein [Actinoplanes sp. L3-i22]BCY07137.1 peptidase [Actinoplanes sp. L3-i22]
MMSRRRYELRDRIAGLDPERDHLEIYQLSAGREFPWDYTRALELALFRTYCVPSISALLAATGEFRDRPQKRYDDTALLMAEIAAHGYDSPRGREALRVVNRAHGRFTISDDDMRYVLSTFVFEPIAWLDRFGWRPPHEHERLAAFHYYREVGKRMGIPGIPAGYAAFARFKQDYEDRHFVFSATNQRVGEYTVGLFAAWFPAFLRPAVRLAVRGMLDEPMLRAFGFPAAPRWVGAAGELGLRVRALTLRWFGRPRRTSVLGVSSKNRTYPGYPAGYRPADLGAQAPSADFPAEHLRRP